MNSRKSGILIRKTTGCLALATALFAGSAQAHECGIQSELMQQLGDNYYHIDGATESAADMHERDTVDVTRASGERHGSDATHSKKTARSLARILEKVQQQEFRRGTGVRYKCKGTGQRVRMESARFELVDIERVHTLDGGSQFNAYEDYREDRIVRSATISLPAKGEWISTGKGGIEHSLRYRNCFFGNGLDSVQHNQPTGRQCVSTPELLLDDNGTFYVQPINPVGSYLGEIRVDARMRGKELLIRETRYINGHKTEWVEWRLRS